MKLYLAAGRYVGTQAEARQADRLFTQVEVPTSKDELIDYLNRVTATRAIELDRAPVAPAMAPPAPRKSDTVQRDISIEEAIGAADHPRAIRLAEHIHSRLMELARH